MGKLEDMANAILEDFNDHHHSAIDEAETEFGDFDEHFDKPLSKEDFEFNQKYYGRNVVFLGDKGKNLKIDSRYVTSREDNIFDYSKAKSVLEYLNDFDTEDFVTYCPRCDVREIDFDTVMESLQYNDDDTLYEQFNLSEPFTTGDDELDNIIRNVDWEDDIKGNFYMYDDYLKKDGTLDMEEVAKSDDPDEVVEYYKEDVEAIQDVKEMIERAKTDGYGDIGEYWAVLRDANHRTQALIMSGEPYIIIRPDDVDYAKDPFYKDKLI